MTSLKEDMSRLESYSDPCIYHLNPNKFEMEAFAMSEKKKVESITNMDDNFSKWYTDVVVKAQLAACSGVRGCMYVHGRMNLP